MKVLLFTNIPIPGRGISGGVQAASCNLISSMSKEDDIRISVIDCYNDNCEDIYIKSNNVECYYLAPPRPKIISRTFSDLKKINRIIRDINPDIIHSHFASTAHIGVKLKIPTVLTAHSSVYESMKNKKGIYNKLNSILYAYYEYKTLHTIKHIIQISPYIYDVFYRRTSARFYPVDNPLSINLFSNDNNVYSEKFITFVGKINEWKSPLHLLMAYKNIYAKYPDVKIKIIGPVDDSKYFEKIKEYCVKYRLYNVEFTGSQTNEDVFSTIKNSYFLVLPSRQETAPMVIAEAMACGKPVVAANVSGIPWLVKDGRTGFLYEYGDIEQLSERMFQLLSDKMLRERLGIAARKEARARFHPDEVVRKTLEIYRQVLKET